MTGIESLNPAGGNHGLAAVEVYVYHTDSVASIP